MVATVTHPHGLQTLFPTLNHPDEGAFLATAYQVLPKGMLGLLIAGIFGATLSNTDAAMNQGVGILVRNFYLPVLNPHCPEKKLLVLSKLCTAAFGIIIVIIGLEINRLRTAGLFPLLNQLGVSLWLPLAIPMCLGLFYKRTPPWSSWSTVLLGLAMSFVVRFCTKPTLFSWIPGLAGPYQPEEINQYYLFATVAVVGVVCVTWFFFTSLFFESSPAEYKAAVEEFFKRLRTPVEVLTSDQLKENHAIVGAIGRLCMIFGGFVFLMVVIPNSNTGRGCFVFCGGIVFIVGALLNAVSRRKLLRQVVPVPLPELEKLTKV